ncbi:hypothetical protein FB446DRAFT_756225 [Lentinula raphanica]|nr:hypothetical protein FB446DRAFT_756225 [Lentinula raphanica]
MRLFSTCLFPKIFSLSIIISAIATPIIIRPRVNEGTPQEGDVSNALVHSSQVSHKSKAVKSKNLELMRLVLIRIERREEKFWVKGLGSEVTPDEYATLALLPVSNNFGDTGVRPYGLRTMPRKAEGGRYTWERDVRYIDRKGKGEIKGARRIILATVIVNYQYEVLGTVRLSPQGKAHMTQAFNNVAPSINLLYLNDEFKAAVEAEESLKKEKADDISVVNDMNSTKWNEFFAAMVKVRGSGGGFAITEKDHPEEWKLYLQAEKDLEKKDPEKKEQEENKRKRKELQENERKKTKLNNVDGSHSREAQDEEDAQLRLAPSGTGVADVDVVPQGNNEAQTLRVDGSREAMEAALFGGM